MVLQKLAVSKCNAARCKMRQSKNQVTYDTVPFQNFALFVEEHLTLHAGKCGQTIGEDYSVLNFIFM
jgi:hypothetical protein